MLLLSNKLQIFFNSIKIYLWFLGFNEGLDSLKYFEILSHDSGEKRSDHFNERKSRQIATHLVRKVKHWLHT